MKGNKGETRDKIIKLLQQHKDVTYTELKFMLGITDAAISKQLSALLKSGTIVFTKEGTRKHYKINPTALKKHDTKMSILSQNYNMLFEGFLIDEYGKTYEDVIDHVSEFMTCMFMYSLVKSMETGQNWFKAFDAKEMAEMTLLHLSAKMLDDESVKSLRNKLLIEGFDEFFTEIKKKHQKQIKSPLTEILGILQEKYYGAFDLLKGEAKEQLD